MARPVGRSDTTCRAVLVPIVLIGAIMSAIEKESQAATGLETEVVDGLSEGEKVVVYPGDKVAEGKRVREISVADR